MLLSIKLDRDRSGPLSELANDVDRRKLSAADISLSGLRPMGVRTKANKISNNDTLVAYETGSPAITGLRVVARGHTRNKATILIDTDAWTYEVQVAPEERKRALVAEVEISIIPVKKVKS